MIIRVTLSSIEIRYYTPRTRVNPCLCYCCAFMMQIKVTAHLIEAIINKTMSEYSSGVFH